MGKLIEIGCWIQDIKADNERKLKSKNIYDLNAKLKSTEILIGRPLRPHQHSYRAVKSTLYYLPSLIENLFENKDVTLCVFLGIGEAFDNTKEGP